MGNGAVRGRQLERGATVTSLTSRISIVSTWKDFSQPASDEALEFWSSKYNMTKEEVKILWNRFRMLNPDESGCISREVFRHPPYSANIFCKQIWFRLPSMENDRDRIPFEVFLKTARWWQYVSNEKKLKLLFQWMSKDGVMTAELLEKVFMHSREELAEEEVKDMAKKSISFMQETGREDGEVEEVLSLEQGARVGEFLKYILSFPEEEVDGSLHFNLTELDPH